MRIRPAPRSPFATRGARIPNRPHEASGVNDAHGRALRTPFVMEVKARQMLSEDFAPHASTSRRFRHLSRQILVIAAVGVVALALGAGVTALIVNTPPPATSQIAR